MRFTRVRRGPRILGACAVVAAFVAGTAGALIDIPSASASPVGPTLVLTPDGGLVGSTFGAAVSGFSPGEVVDVSIGGNNESCTADDTGSCTASLSVPPVPQEPYQYTVEADGETSGLVADATYYVVPEPDFTFVSPPSGPIGTEVTVGLADWPEEATVSFGYGEGPNGTGDIFGEGCTPDPMSSGSCTVTAQIPSDFGGGLHEFWADPPGDTDNAELVVADFIVTPTISATPASGPSGSTFDLTANGFQSSEEVDASFDGTPVGSCTADATGYCVLSGATVPARPTNTAYQITAKGKSSLMTASTSFTVTSGLGVSPSAGSVGSTTTATVSGFGAVETVDLAFNGAPAGHCVTDATGGCIAAVTVPQLPSGSYTVSAVGETTGTTGSATFEVTPDLVLTPSTASPGSTFTAAVSGFAADEEVSLDPFPEQCLTDATGACSMSVAVPIAPPASYPVTATGGTSGLTASANFILSTGLVLAPAAGPAGTQVTATAEGYPVEDVVSILYNGDVVSSCTANDGGGCTTTFTVPALPATTYAVDATGGGLEFGANFTETVPTVTLNQTQGVQGSTLDATVSGFVPGESVGLSFDGHDTGDPCTTDSTGFCTIDTGTVPAEQNGTYDVEALGATSDSADTSFTIEPSIALDPASGPPGFSPSVTATGFQAGETVVFMLNGNIFGGCDADGTGDCTGTVFVEGFTPPGPVGITAEGMTSSLTTGATYTVVTLSGTPTLGLTPSSGLPGSTFDATLSNFYPGISVELYFDSVDTGLSCTPDDTGACTIDNVSAPNVPAGYYGVVAQQGSTTANASATFTVLPTLQISPDSGAAGDSINATVSNFVPLETVQFRFSDSSTVYVIGSCATDDNGACSTSLTIPAQALAGADTVTAFGEGSNVGANADIHGRPGRCPLDRHRRPGLDLRRHAVELHAVRAGRALLRRQRHRDVLRHRRHRRLHHFWRHRAERAGQRLHRRGSGLGG